MQAFSRRIHIEAGQPLGGNSRKRLSIDSTDELELNGWAFDDEESGRTIELCTLDALYAGDLVDAADRGCGPRRILAASHTHFAPMLDSHKPRLGQLSRQGMNAWLAALDDAPRVDVQPERCVIYRSEVPVPVYRRFDVPDSPFNRFLTRYAGSYPNEQQPVDKNLYLFEFSRKGKTEFVISLHACHPVSRADPLRTSPDYVGAVRDAIRNRFGYIPCLFLLGCSGDIRPNVARKRIRWLPRNRLNWRFDWQLSTVSQQQVDHAYAQAVCGAQPWQFLDLTSSGVRIEARMLFLVHQGQITYPCIVVGKRLRFDFVPFEVSHLFHLDAQKRDPLHFIVTCVDRTLGYLPHPRQIPVGGYEVDGSRNCMDLAQRALVRPGGAW